MEPLSAQAQKQYDDLAATISRGAEVIGWHLYKPCTPETLRGKVALLVENVQKLAAWTPGYATSTSDQRVVSSQTEGQHMITVYMVEDKDRKVIWNEGMSPYFANSGTENEQFQKADAYAQERNGAVIASEFEFSDSEMIHDYTDLDNSFVEVRA